MDAEENLAGQKQCNICNNTLPRFETMSSHYISTVISIVSKTLLEILLNVSHKNMDEYDEASGYLASGA